MSFDATVRKIGNSVGVVFPKEYARSMNLQVNEKVRVNVVREADFSDIYGSLKAKKSTQKFKDEARAGWK
jgi:antitoxin component of MazEF toxin-antitoxin module